jgi:hypothetical protein
MIVRSSEHRVALYHWAIAVAIASSVHAALAAVLLLWYKPTTPARPPDAIVIDLVPPPALPTSPAAPQVEQRLAPEQAASAASSDKAIEQAERRIEEQVAVRSDQKPAPSPVEESAAPAKPTAPAEEGPTQEKTQAAPAGAPAGAVQPGAGAGGPIDFRIAEPHRARIKRSAWKDAIMGRTPKGYGLRQQPPGPSVPGSMARNAIGMAVPDGAAAKGLAGYSAPNLRDGLPRNAVAATAVENVTARSAPGVIGSPAPNAIGLSAPNHPTVVGLNVARPAVSPVAAVRPLSKTGINGTTMIRPGTSMGGIGGPARTAAGVINGTSIRPRP